MAVSARILKILKDGPEDGPRAMARDESLVRWMGDGEKEGQVVGRGHGWLKPTLSLGRAQDLPSELAEDARRCGIEVVRRPTGGGWLLHLPGDLAVSVAFSGPLRAGDFRRAARIASQAIALGLAHCGLPALVFTGLGLPASRADICFQRADRDEVVLGSTKVAGVALARFGGSALVQAAIPLAPLSAELLHFAEKWDAGRQPAVQATAGAGRDRIWSGAVEALGKILEASPSIWHWPGPLLKRAEELRYTRYLSESFTRGRKARLMEG